MQVFIGLHENQAAVVVGIAVLQKQMDQIDHEEHHEDEGGTSQLITTAGADGLVGDIVHGVQDAQCAGQKEHGHGEDEYPRIEQGIETMRGVGPMTNNRRHI